MKLSNLLFFVSYAIIVKGDTMRRFLWGCFFVCLIGIILVNKDEIANFILSNYYTDEVAYFDEPNEYFKSIDYSFVQNTDSLYPSSRQDILNIIYSSLNRGSDSVTFYCDSHYSSCIDDVNDIAENSLYLSTINNLVHPFNSYSNIHFTINTYGKVSIDISRNYSDADILLVNNKIDEIMDSIISDDMSVYDKILVFHDYIVNNTVYDNSVNINNQMNSDTNSNNALGLLYENKAICSGYSDTMAIFLSRLGLNNYRISSDLHIWNLVFFENEWKHIDITWDDPVTNNGVDVLLHDFFLIDTDELFEKEKLYEKDNHSFDKRLYLEAL